MKRWVQPDNKPEAQVSPIPHACVDTKSMFDTTCMHSTEGYEFGVVLAILLSVTVHVLVSLQTNAQQYRMDCVN